MKILIQEKIAELESMARDLQTRVRELEAVVRDHERRIRMLESRVSILGFRGAWHPIEDLESNPHWRALWKSFDALFKSVFERKPRA